MKPLPVLLIYALVFLTSYLVGVVGFAYTLWPLTESSITETLWFTS